MKNIIVVTGGAGFVGSSLIKNFLKLKKYKIISIDNYFSGSKLNHIKSHRVKYLNTNTVNINKKLHLYKKKIHTIFHFGEFSRIFQSFDNLNECFNSNVIGSAEVFKFCLNYKIKLVYSASSAVFKNKKSKEIMSPYVLTKKLNLEILDNLKKWSKLNCEIIYFYNVYGPGQICEGKMATVLGIFEHCYRNNRALPVVKPGFQRRRFTHIDQTVASCIYAWKKNQKKHYIVASNKSFSVLEIAKMFRKNIKYLPARKGDRYYSNIKKKYLGNKIITINVNNSVEEYINSLTKELI
jgi:UDP-glucose 4-epimerase